MSDTEREDGGDTEDWLPPLGPDEPEDAAPPEEDEPPEEPEAPEEAPPPADPVPPEPPASPPPSTWAGRRAQGDHVADEDDDVGGSQREEVEEGEEAEEATEGSGFTSEFDELEREFTEDLEAELAAEHAVPPLDDEEGEEPRAEEDPAVPAPADEGPAPEEPAAEEPAAEEQAEAPPDEPVRPETVEADTLALADEEQAREAAHKGLSERTAEHAAKRGVTDPGKAPETPQPAPAAPAQTPPARPAEPAAIAYPAAAGGGSEEESPRSGLWARFMAASFLIIVSMATATSVSILVYLTDIAKGLGGLDLASQLDDIDEEAQNFLIIGSDVRPDQTSKGLSDTTMLLRVDPDGERITQLSIPRDLKVNVPGHGVEKFNAAYSFGGPRLTLKVVKQITGDRIPVNHVVNVDFNGFADAVDAIGCVYIDVDRHYFNDNSTAATLEEQYAEIDIDAGYQRLCGLKALQYVRYRHNDNDIVRAARQQTFLREARQKVPPGKLLDERDKLLTIFTDYTTSDINDSGTLVELFKLMLDARNADVTQVEFPVDSLNERGYVTAGDAPLRKAVNDFLGVGANGSGGGEGGQEASGGGSGGGQADESKSKKKKKKSKSGSDPVKAAAAEMADVTVSAQGHAARILDEGGRRLKFPVLYPTLLPPNSSIIDDTRYFGIDGGGGRLFHGYKFVMARPGTTYPTAYLGVSGTDWVNAPLFANPSAKRKIGKREYRLYYDGGQLRMLAFERKKAMYWVTNTLDKLLTEPQMIAIAQNLREVGS